MCVFIFSFLCFLVFLCFFLVLLLLLFCLPCMLPYFWLRDIVKYNRILHLWHVGEERVDTAQDRQAPVSFLNLLATPDDGIRVAYSIRH